jgi:pyrroloquinoline quinone biosynthesis protein D
MRPRCSAGFSVRADVPRYARGVRMHVEGDEAAFLLVPEGVLDLNPTARAILELVDGNRSTDEIATVLSERYEVPREELLADVNDLCLSLRERGFLS